MSTINFGSTINLNQAASLIQANPELRFLLQGEPGIGKSSLLKALGNLTGYPIAYIDVPNMDLGDIAMPVVNKDTKVTEYYPNSRFQLHLGKPVIIMLDEFTKGADPVKNMLHPLLEKVNPRLGDVPVPEGSLIFLTGNLSTDGVGDNIKAHTLGRIVKVEVHKPNAQQWLSWAVNNDIAPEVCAWVERTPQVLASYRDPGEAENPYIFQPKRPNVAYVSPRSLETASTLVKNRQHFDKDALICALKGAIGESGARDMQAFIEFADQLPHFNAILKDPTGTPVPASAGACCLIAFGAIQKVTAENISAFMTYLQRMAPEWQSVFCINIARTPAKQAVAFSSRAFAEWVGKNQDLL